MDMHQLMGDFQTRVQALDNKARKIAPNLFLFDEYHPKRIPEGIDNDEVAFWYLIVDLYGLFHDAGKYIFDTPEWSRSNGATVKAFHDALNEMRSVFCHNKPPTAYLPRLITDNRCLNNLVTTWMEKAEPVTHLLTRSSDIVVPYRGLFDLFLTAAMKVLDLIDGELLGCFENYVRNEDDGGIYDNWFTPIFNWYWNNTTVYIRAWNCYCNRNSSGVNQAFRNARDTKNIDNKLKNWLTNYGCAGKREQFRYNMYYRHFSLHAGAALRQNLTPYNLFEPLLRNFDDRIIPKQSLFAPATD